MGPCDQLGPGRRAITTAYNAIIALQPPARTRWTSSTVFPSLDYARLVERDHLATGGNVQPTINLDAGTYELDGGTIANATINLGGGTLNIASGTLNGVSVSGGNLIVPIQSQSLPEERA